MSTRDNRDRWPAPVSAIETLERRNAELEAENASQREAIAELRRVNDAMERLLGSTEIATVFLDADLRIRRCTPRIAQVLHIRRQDLGRRLHDFAHHIARASLIEDVQRVLQGGESFETEVRDLAGIPYLLRVVPHRGGSELEARDDGILLTLTDISNLDDTRSRLAVMSSIVESCDDAIIGIGLDGSIRTWNASATRVFGYGALEALGQNVVMLCPPVEVETARAALDRMRRGEPVEAVPAFRAHKNGSLLATSATMSPIWDERGIVSGGSVIARDVSALRLAQRQAQERQELVSLLLDSTAEAVYGLDNHGKCTFCNKTCATLLGYDDPREIVGQDMHALMHGKHPDGAAYPLEECPIHRGFRDEEPVHRDDEAFVRKDGSTFSVEYRAHPLRHNDETLGMVVTFLDITDRKRSEDEMRTAALRREQFLAMLSHELRNPLAAVLNATTVLREGDGNDTSADSARQVIERQTRHMSRLLDDLLDVSRITSGKFQLRKHPFDLHNAIQAGVESLAPMVAKREIDLVLDIDAEPLPILGDPVRLQQVVSNLLSNAARYSDTGGRVELTVRKSGAEAIIAVRDYGEGMDMDLLPQIFDLFVQSAQQLDRSRGGLGVGLSLVRQIVEAHRGTVRATSEGRGTGSEFVVRLPLTASLLPIEEEEPMAVDVTPKRVVLVEDQGDAREMLSLLLTARGHQVFEAEDGPRALEAIERERPDAAIVDIGLPTMSGYDVARAVRANRALDSVTLVALTGYGAHADIQAAREAGFDAHLTKPADTTRIEAVLARSRRA